MATRSWSTLQSKTEKEYKLSGKMRDFAIVTKLYEKGRLYIGSDQMTSTVFEQFRLAVRIINDIYENQWDISFKIQLVNKLTKSGKSVTCFSFSIDGIVILFEDIIIRNTSRGNRGHAIKDLIVKIPLGTGRYGLRVSRPKGCRLTMSYAEWQSHYFHSHLDTTQSNIIETYTFPVYKSFCTGSGEINIYEQNINGDGLTESNFTQFAMQIITLATHESIEGTPYRNYSNISALPNSGNRYSEPGTSLIDGFYRYIISYYKSEGAVPININISFNSNKMYEINEDDTYNQFLKTPFEKMDRLDDYRRYWCVIGEHNVYYRYNDAPGYGTVPNFRDKKTIFRGVERTFTVESPEMTLAPLTNTIHPTFIKQFKNKLEYELNKKRITESTINRYKNQDSNARESLEADPVSV